MPLPRLEPDAAAALSLDGERVDLHFHTRHSDGRATARQAVERARALDLRVAITDHNVVGGAMEAWLLADREGDASRVIPGIEITTAERVHLLVYFRTAWDLLRFYERAVQPHRPRGATATTVLPRSAEAVLDDLRGFDALTSAAHPFAVAKNGWLSARERYAYLRDLMGELDAAEVLNGEELDAGNAQAAALLRGDARLAATAGSDGHTLGELGAVAMALPAGADLFEAIRGRHGTLLDGRPPGDWRRAASHTAKIPYFASRPFVFAYRYAVRASELALEQPLPPRT